MGVVDKEAKRIYMRAWRQRNIEKRRAYEREYQKKWYRANRDKRMLCPSMSPEARYWYGLEKKYGLTKAAFAKLVEDQDGLCPICGGSLEQPLVYSKDKQVVVDHNHITNRVRGIAHNRCNSAIGVLGDSVSGLKRALAYLEATDGN